MMPMLTSTVDQMAIDALSLLFTVALYTDVRRMMEAIQTLDVIVSFRDM